MDRKACWAAVLAVGLMAQDVCRAQVAATAKIGTLGLGGDVTVGLVESHLNLRAGYNAYNGRLDVKLDEADVRGAFDWQTIPVLLDWHMFGGDFRLSFGGVINNNEVRLSAIPNEPIELDGMDYNIKSLTGKMTFDEFGGYLGIGTGNALDKDGRWHFMFDLGVMYHGEPQVSARAVASDPAMQAQLNSALQKDVADVQDDISPFRYYPVMSLGVSFRF